jgi:uncharacterized protein (TIGR00299 family) protein
MTLAYFDCPAGASGDMILGSLIDAGYPATALREGIAKLGLAGVSVAVSRVERNGIGARRVVVREKARVPELRVLPGIRRIIERANYPERVASRAVAILTALARAEAKIHRVPVEKVHFHEIGAADTIVDIVGACLALEHFGIERIEASPLPLGRGTVRVAHGVLPLPAPATVELLRGVPVVSASALAETVTPTGAAILATLATGFGSIPAMTIARVGYGAGMREDEGSPNVLRALIGAASPASLAERAVVLEASVDDMTPQQFEPLMARLFEAGAQDVSLTPTMMKKNRPAITVTVIGPTPKREALARVLLTHSTTIGLRHWDVGRIVLPREVVTVKTRYGAVRLKLARLDGRVVNVGPEYDDCAAFAAKHGVPLKAVLAEAIRAADAAGYRIETTG